MLQGLSPSGAAPVWRKFEVCFFIHVEHAHHEFDIADVVLVCQSFEQRMLGAAGATVVGKYTEDVVLICIAAVRKLAHIGSRLAKAAQFVTDTFLGYRAVRLYFSIEVICHITSAILSPVGGNYLISPFYTSGKSTCLFAIWLPFHSLQRSMLCETSHLHCWLAAALYCHAGPRYRLLLSFY